MENENIKRTVILLSCIEDEKNGIGYVYSEEDGKILKQIFSELNCRFSSNYQYLAELSCLNIVGAGEIYAKYIKSISSQIVRAYLVHQIVSDRVSDVDKLILDLYISFKHSPEYISNPYFPSEIYDNAFRRLKPKRLKKELTALVQNPKDAYLMPFTVRMLASWKAPNIKDLLMSFLDSSNINFDRFGTDEEQDPSLLSYARQQLKFDAIYGLRYYGDPKPIKVFCDSSDQDISLSAKKSLEYIENHSK